LAAPEARVKYSAALRAGKASETAENFTGVASCLVDAGLKTAVSFRPREGWQNG
jgi:hypothetical protein